MKRSVVGAILCSLLIFSFATAVQAKVVVSDIGTSIFSNRFMPAEGEASALIIPVEFSDFTFDEDPVAFLNKVFFGTGTEDVPSLATYFHQASYGELTVTGKVQQTVTFDVPRNHYDDNHTALIADLFSVLQNRGVDFSDYDSNHDGVVDALYFVWAGTPQSRGGDWWPYSDTYYWDFIQADIQIGSYSSLSYEMLKDASAFRRATAIHETGHQLGLTDYYGPGSESGTNAVVMMDRNAGDEDVFSKTLLGWVEPQVITESAYIHLKSASVHGDALMLTPHDWDGNYLSEYFMVEYITPEANQATQNLPEEGAIRVWHVNSATSLWTNEITSSMYRYSNDSEDEYKLITVIDSSKEWYTPGDFISEDSLSLYNGEGTGFTLEVISTENGEAMLCVTRDGVIPAKPEKEESSSPSSEESKSEESTGESEESSEDKNEEWTDESEDTPGEEEPIGEESEDSSEMIEENNEENNEENKVVKLAPVGLAIGVAILVIALILNGKGQKKSANKKKKKRKK